MAVESRDIAFDLKTIDRDRIIAKAQRYLPEEPLTVTGEQCERSGGGPHDYYSEGDYWWPNPEDPKGPYIRRDGETNPDLFYAHRYAMVRLSEIVGTFASAYFLTADASYAARGIAHLRAWFADPETRMNTNLLYGQAIKGLHSGRSIGIIDTLHLTEVALGAKLLSGSRAMDADTDSGIRNWFRSYLDWIQTHPYGQTERVHPNNHGVCWSMQAAAFAHLLGDEDVLKWVRNQFRSVYLDEMMDDRGAFPAELARTKPYGYSLFVIDAMAGVAQIASTPDDDLWEFGLEDGRGMLKGVEFIAPYIADKYAWPFGEDILYWDDWPVRHPSLLLGALRFGRSDWLASWSNLEPDPMPFEVQRNLPLRHPLIWS